MFAALSLLVGVFRLGAQPSGGPYGPVALDYPLPEVTGTIYFVAPEGESGVSGTELGAPTTLEAAIARAVTGDAIVLRGGTYRTGNLVFNQGILIQPYADERPVLKGTRVAAEWEALRDGVWRTAWATLFPMRPQPWWRYHREGMRTPLHRFNNDMVFVDGRMLQSAGWMGAVDENHFFVDYENGHVYIGLDPTARTVEITAFDNAFTRVTEAVHGREADRRGFTLRGLTMTQYAYRAIEIAGYDPEGYSPNEEHGNDVVGSLLEHCTITHCSRVAAYLRGDHLTVRHCLVSDTSTEGLFILASDDVLLERNIFRRNNIEKITGYYPAAVKIFNQCDRVTVRENLVLEQPDSNGIWWDVGNEDGVFVNNWIIGAIDGFFFEISRGAVCAGNVFVDCHKGVRVLNAADVAVYQNTFVDSPAAFERTTRGMGDDHFGWHIRTGPPVDDRDGHAFANNLLIATEAYDRPLLLVEQVPELCGRLTEPQFDHLDHNVYVRIDPPAETPLLRYSPVDGEACNAEWDGLAPLRATGAGFAAASRHLEDDHGPLVRSLRLGHYDLRPEFPALEAAGSLPPEVAELLGWSRVPGFPGAFPPRQ